MDAGTTDNLHYLAITHCLIHGIYPNIETNIDDWFYEHFIQYMPGTLLNSIWIVTHLILIRILGGREIIIIIIPIL